jgi:hypothetical protein
MILLPIAWPIFVGFLMRRIPPVGRVWALFVVIYAFGLPYGLTHIEGALCLQTAFGYFVNGVFRYDVGSQIFGILFAAGIAAGTAGIISLFAFRWRWTLLVDAVVNLMWVLVDVRYWERFGKESITVGTMLRVSPGFHVIPVGTIVIAIILLVTRGGKAKKE